MTGAAKFLPQLMNFNVSIEDGNHLSSGSSPSWGSGMSKAQLLLVLHSDDFQSWLFLLKWLHIHIEIPFQVFWNGIKPTWTYVASPL